MEVIKVKMTADQTGSTNGIQVKTYLKDKEYDLPEDLANAFCDEIKCAKRVAEKKTAKPKAEG